jgi:hypothetical protein
VRLVGGQFADGRIVARGYVGDMCGGLTL